MKKIVILLTGLVLTLSFSSCMGLDLFCDIIPYGVDVVVGIDSHHPHPHHHDRPARHGRW